MSFITSSEQDALRNSASRFVAERYDPATHRERIDASGPFNRANWREITELGWLGTAIDEANGGIGLAHSFLSVLAEALGPALMCEPFTSQTALVGHLLDRALPGGPRDDVLDRWLRGDDCGALAHYDGLRGVESRSPGATTFDERDGLFVLTGRKTAVIDGGIADHLIVSAVRNAPRRAVGLFLISAGSDGLRIDGYRSFDGRHVADVELSGVRVAQDARLQFASSASDVVDEALSLYAFLLASESLGIMQAAIRATHDYLVEREQFGQKLAEFQVLQHRLVDMLLAATRAESIVQVARHQVDTLGLPGAAEFIAAAKVEAGVAGTFIGREAIQLHGAIGMTDEFIVGHYLKRLTANDLLAGNTDEQISRFARLRGLR